MPAAVIRSAKTTRPRVGHAVARPRLFGPLDACRRRGGALWVQGIPGGGKTTLLSTWLQARRLRSAWLKVDPGDADLASFFHHLALSAGPLRPAAAPPVETPGHAATPELLARGRFRALFSSLRRGSVIVLDDLQEAGGALDGVLRAALEELAPGVMLVLCSRSAPPGALARFRSSGELAVLGELDLGLTDREALAVARRLGFRAGASALAPIIDGAGGWPAGVVLRLLDVVAGRGTGRWGEHRYLAAEVFDRLDPSTRQVLLEAALVLPAPAGQLEAATGRSSAGPLLASLAERGLFTLRHESWSPTFDLHEPFRDFLLERGQRDLPEARRAEVRRAAALWLASRPDSPPDATFDLLAEVGAHAEAAALLCRAAPALLREGRWSQVEGWLARLPPSLREADPWLQHWAGRAAAPRRPVEARGHLDRALALFEQAGDAAGLWLTWAARVEAVIDAWTDLTPLEEALRDLERLEGRFPCPGGEVELRVLLATHAAASLVAPHHPAIPACREALRGMALAAPSVELRLEAGARLLLHEACFLGEVELGRELLDGLVALADDQAAAAAPAALRRWRACLASIAFAGGDLETAASAAGTCAAHADQERALAWDFLARAQLFSVALIRAPETAPARLRELALALRPGATVDAAILRWAEGLAALRSGDPLTAVSRGEAALERATSCGHVMAQAMSLLLVARARGRAGDPHGAGAALAQVRDLGERAGSCWIRAAADFIEAERLLDEGTSERWIPPLVEALSLVRTNGVHPFPLFGAAEVARLLDVALERGVEAETVRRLVGRWRLTAPPDARSGAAWPWPVRIRVLGDFSVERHGAPLFSPGRLPRKPLDLLRLLAIHGGRDVPEHVAAGALWPEAEGDAAQHALETTLYRLRRLIGPEAVLQRGRQLSLSRRHCWVDAFELEERLDRALAALERRRPDAAELLERELPHLSELCHEPLLGDAEDLPWASEPRARLRRRVARLAGALSATAGGGPFPLDPALRPARALRIAS